MGVVEVKLKAPVEQPVDAIVWTSSMGTRVLTVRQDSGGAKRATIVFQKFGPKRWDGTRPVAQEVKSSVFPSELREVAKGFLQLADAIDGKA